MKLFFRRKTSCQVAKDRLKILLISDGGKPSLTASIPIEAVQAKQG